MKLFKMIALLVSLMFLMTGCVSTSESPESLIDKKPIYNEENKELYDTINNMLVKPTSLTLPSNSQDVGEINKVDLNNDGVDEVVAFEKKKNLNTNENEVGFMIFAKKNDGTYEEKVNLLKIGESIDYANFYDLDNDGNKEIVLSIKGHTKTRLYLYRYVDENIEEIYNLEPTWIENKGYLSDMKIKIGYINDDNILDILMVNYDYKNSEMYVSILNFNNKMNLIDYVKFENVKNINDLYITFGNLASQVKGSTIKGVVLDIPMIKDSSYFTQMIYLENGTIKKAFKDDDKKLMKSYYIPVEDINKDKVIDIPVLNGSLNENTYTSKSSSNISWYRWNGKSGDDSELLFTIQIYYNYDYNYKFLIPNNLANKIYIKQEQNIDSTSFKFCYNDFTENKPKPLFTITASSKNIVDENKNIKLVNQSSIIIKETEKYNYSLSIDDTKELERLNITKEALKDYFSLIYE